MKKTIISEGIYSIDRFVKDDVVIDKQGYEMMIHKDELIIAIWIQDITISLEHFHKREYKSNEEIEKLVKFLNDTYSEDYLASLKV